MLVHLVDNAPWNKHVLHCVYVTLLSGALLCWVRSRVNRTIWPLWKVWRSLWRRLVVPLQLTTLKGNQILTRSGCCRFFRSTEVMFCRDKLDAFICFVLMMPRRGSKNLAREDVSGRLRIFRRPVGHAWLSDWRDHLGRGLLKDHARWIRHRRLISPQRSPLNLNPHRRAFLNNCRDCGHPIRAVNPRFSYSSKSSSSGLLSFLAPAPDSMLTCSSFFE